MNSERYDSHAGVHAQIHCTDFQVRVHCINCSLKYQTRIHTVMCAHFNNFLLFIALLSFNHTTSTATTDNDRQVTNNSTHLDVLLEGPPWTPCASAVSIL